MSYKNKAMNFEGALLEKQQELKPLVHDYLSQKQQALQLMHKGFLMQCKQLLSREQQKLNWLSEDVRKAATGFLRKEEKELVAFKKYFELLSPQQMLRKGYAIIHYADPSDLEAKVGEELVIETLKQHITTKVIKTEKHEKD